MPKRKVLQSIKINNGNLTYEIDPTSSNWRRDGSWYRNGKKFTPNSLSKYSYVKNNIRYALTPEGSTYPEQIYKLSLKANNYSNTVQAERQDKAFKKIKHNGDYITLNIPGSSMHTAKVPTNMLDSIIISSARSNTPIKQNLGLVGKEDTFAHANTKHGITHFNKHDIVNNHAYADKNPYYDYLINAYNISDDKKREADVKYALSHEDSIIHKNSDTIYDENDPLADAFLRYNAAPNKYNSGQGNYQQMVNIIGDKVYNEPQVAAYLNSKHAQEVYRKGVNERKRKTLSGDY